MKTFRRLTGIPAIILLLAFSTPVLAMDEMQEKEFSRISHMSLAELTEQAKNTLTKKYPGEKWEAYRFPNFVFTNVSVEAAYKIAVKRPELLAKIPCYCPCDTAGHKNLRDCFLKKGEPGKYDSHASFCITCYTQAMLAFLWAELGATDHEILEGMQQKFKP